MIILYALFFLLFGIGLAVAGPASLNRARGEVVHSIGVIIAGVSAFVLKISAVVYLVIWIYQSVT